ncbi:MAG: VOC family protein [Bacteroidota bacterium]|nr:VOC family protein [Bacteroidota bacterium]
MKIEHLAIWVDDLETMKAFYLKYFDTNAGEKYTNEKNRYTAYFIYFGEGKTRLELMNKPNISPGIGQRGFTKGIAHFTISVGGKEKVNELTETLRSDGYKIFSEARTTGDGYYESVVLDPEGNYLEISA